MGEESIEQYGGVLAAPPQAPRRIIAGAVAAAAALAVALTAVGHGSAHPSPPRLVATLTDHGDGLPSLAFSPDGSTLATAGDGLGHVFLWDAATHRLIATLTGPRRDSAVSSVAFSPDGGTLAASGGLCGDGSAVHSRVYLWDAATRRLIATLTDPRSGYGVNAVAFSPHGRVLATGDDGSGAYLWDAATGRMTATLTRPNGSPTPSDGHTYLWDVG